MTRTPIVVALDLSEYAEIVMEHGIDLAAREAQPELHFIHVVDRDSELEATREQLGELVLDGLEVLNDLGPSDHQPHWRARLHVRVGKPHEEIADLAAEVRAKLLVVGRFGQHNRRRRLGSIAHQLIEIAPCPTLVVGLHDEPNRDEVECPDCAKVRADSDGESWFCAAHSGDRVAMIVPTSIFTGSRVLW